MELRVQVTAGDLIVAVQMVFELAQLPQYLLPQLHEPHLQSPLNHHR